MIGKRLISSTRFWTGFKLAVTVVVLGYVVRQVDLRAVAAILRTASLPRLALSVVLFALIPLLGGVRWWIILKAIKHPDRLSPLIALFWVGMLFGQIAPAAAGDGARILLAARRGHGLTPIVHSVFLDRVILVLMLLLLVLATQQLLIHRLGSSATFWIVPVLLLVGMAGTGLLMAADRLTRRWGRWRLIRALAALSADTRRTLFSWWSWPLSGLGLFTHLNFVMAASQLGNALHLHLLLLDYLAFIPLVTTAMILPISMGGWGVREGLLIFLLQKVGIPPDQALTFSLLLGLAVLTSSLPGLVAWWLNPDRKVSKILEDAPHSSQGLQGSLNSR